jgi:hypothetical protein
LENEQPRYQYGRDTSRFYKHKLQKHGHVEVFEEFDDHLYKGKVKRKVIRNRLVKEAQDAMATEHHQIARQASCQGHDDTSDTARTAATAAIHMETDSAESRNDSGSDQASTETGDDEGREEPTAWQDLPDSIELDIARDERG